LKDKLCRNLLEILYEFVPQIKDKIEFFHLATPLTEETFLGSYKGGAYDTLCTPDMFAPINQQWITTPRTQIPGLYLAGSSAFFPGLTGAMYGGLLCACNVLGYLGTIRLSYDLLTHLAMRLREDNPKLTWFQAYYEAVDKFMNE
jgi:all-trans-retinol 13,14-reductase